MSVRREIRLSAEDRKFIAKAFGVTLMMVSQACNYMRNSDLAKKIRILAIKRGGEEVLVAPLCETIHLSDGTMVQYFDNKCTLRCNMRTGYTEVLKDDELVEQYHRMTLPQLYELQGRIESGLV